MQHKNCKEEQKHIQLAVKRMLITKRDVVERQTCKENQN